MKNKFIVIIIFLIFFVPLLSAWLLYKNEHGISEKTTNYGQLITPPRNFSQLVLKTKIGALFDHQPLNHHWLLLYVNPKNSCDNTCQKMLYNLRQIQRATGKNQLRSVRVILTFNNKNRAQLDELMKTQDAFNFHVIADKQQFLQLMANLPSTPLAISEGSLYLVDPQGNILMDYPLNADPSRILRDLERLLRISQIG